MDTTGSILESIIREIRPPKLRDDEILKLAFFLPDETVLEALKIVDLGQVETISARDGRTIYAVKGSSRSYYIYSKPFVTPRSHSPTQTDTGARTRAYCSCPAFGYAMFLSSGTSSSSSLSSEKQREGEDQYQGSWCKHLLATRLAIALDQTRTLKPSLSELQGEEEQGEMQEERPDMLFALWRGMFNSGEVGSKVGI
ncbi:Zinc finger, SWIM-type [Phaffia rhodozyma]|uniref:Zinc finger, SWIM-type n=1 Tax=Phaffia rhodozyma TaxID=264483 RepID=A0A0F7SLR4_PHARH|nr:Zinc finger, SWIM-type [Phaffia rhodozyma]